MKKLSLAVLAAATVLTMASAPFTSQAAMMRVAGGVYSGQNRPMTICSSQNRDLTGRLNQMGIRVNGQSCNLNQSLNSNSLNNQNGFSCNMTGCENGSTCGIQNCESGSTCGIHNCERF